MPYLVSKEEVIFYDIAVQDWPGEIEFYRSLVRDVKQHNGKMLDIACGTGRVSLQLVSEGVPISGLDISSDMLAAIRRKSDSLTNVHWFLGDMRDFNLGEQFDLIIIPGHAFQFMLTSQDQAACLNCIRRHLSPNGKLVIHLDHQDLGWLGGLDQGWSNDFQLAGEYHLPGEEGSVRKWNVWSYEPVTQTASVITAWETIGKNGMVTKRVENPEKKLHCVFRFEMEHLLARTGFEVEALYGDFFRHSLGNTSSDMIWVARASQ